MPTGQYIRSEDVRKKRAELVRQKWANGDYADRKKAVWTADRKKVMAEQANKNFGGKRGGLLGTTRPEDVRMRISESKIGVALDADGRKKRTIEKVKEYRRTHMETVVYPTQRRYRVRNRKQLNHKQKDRFNNDQSFRLKVCLRESVRRALKGKAKAARTMELVGCSVEDLKRHLESLFTHGMDWGNYGFWGWHIDHIRPCASFDLQDEEQQRQCFHFTNLQPLWRDDNLRKGSRRMA